MPTTSGGGPEIRVVGTAYPAGDTLRAKLVNRSPDPVLYGACSLALERETSGAWAVALPETELCIAIGSTLRPGGSAPLKLHLPSTLVPGEYRLRQRILPRERPPGLLIHSPPFTLRPPSRPFE